MIWSIRCTVDDASGEKALTRIVRDSGALLSRRSTVTIYNSKRAKWQHEALGYANNGVVIGNGFDLKRFVPKGEAGESARVELGLPTSEFVVLMIAREDPMKDYENFLKSAVIVQKERQDVTFVAVGRGVPELHRRSHECDAAIRTLGPKLRLIPELRDVMPVLHAADVFVLSSAWGEAFPNVLGEAMASGLPCVATDVGDCAEIIGDAGLVVPPRSPSMLAQGILSLVNLPEGDRLDIGRRARKRIDKRYSIEAVAGEYESIWRQVSEADHTELDRVG
jgi:glycosyltransferase involved in cell wall biosynthesis